MPKTRTVAREHAPRAIPAVRRRRKSDNVHMRVRVSPTGDRFAPIVVAAIHAFFVARNLLAIRDETRAFFAGDNGSVERGKRIHFSGV
jgi:hypothetical protein